MTSPNLIEYKDDGVYFNGVKPTAGVNIPGAATSVVQPYLVVKIWQRTA